ncbi:hypothetical protein L1887_07119 [Cichorium endivia]|nr:hypothetical protein L1887_07119 [Cichorium endivia]
MKIPMRERRQGMSYKLFIATGDENVERAGKEVKLRRLWRIRFLVSYHSHTQKGGRGLLMSPMASGIQRSNPPDLQVSQCVRMICVLGTELIIGAQHTGDGKVVSVKVLWLEKKGWNEKKDPVGLGRSSTWGVRHVVVVGSLSPVNATSPEDAVVGFVLALLLRGLCVSFVVGRKS